MKKITPKKILLLSIVLGTGLFLTSFISAQTGCPLNTTVEETQATLVGEVTDDGGDPNLEVWFQYGTTTSYGSESNSSSQYGTGVFCATVYNLTPCTAYNYRAVAENSADISYGENKTFTSKCPVSVNLKANSSDGPITVSYKSNVVLSWDSSNASYCEASGDWSGTKASSGNQTIQMNQVTTHTFTLICKDSTGTKTATDSVVVEVTANPPTVITLPAVVTY
jgi:hypothetical protein